MVQKTRHPSVEAHFLRKPFLASKRTIFCDFAVFCFLKYFGTSVVIFQCLQLHQDVLLNLIIHSDRQSFNESRGSFLFLTFLFLIKESTKVMAFRRCFFRYN